MLVLQRQPGDSFTIDTGNGVVTVTITRVDGRQVHVGIDAPRHMAIHRDDAVNREPKHQHKENP